MTLATSRPAARRIITDTAPTLFLRSLVERRGMTLCTVTTRYNSYSKTYITTVQAHDGAGETVACTNLGLQPDQASVINLHDATAAAQADLR